MGQRSLPWTCSREGRRRGARTADLVGGDDPLARVLEQLLVPPVWVLAGQPLRAQVVIAEPEQTQRLQEGLPVPSLRPEGCIRRGGAGEEMSGSVIGGAHTRRPPAGPVPPWRPHRTAPWVRSVRWRGRAPPTLTGASASLGGRRGRALTPAVPRRSSAARRSRSARSHRWRCRPASPSPGWSAGHAAGEMGCKGARRGWAAAGQGRPGPGGCPRLGSGRASPPGPARPAAWVPADWGAAPSRRLPLLTRSRGLLGLRPVLGSQRLLWKGSTTSPRWSGSNTGSPGGMRMLRNSAGQPGVSTPTTSERTW